MFFFVIRAEDGANNDVNCGVSVKSVLSRSYIGVTLELHRSYLGGRRRQGQYCSEIKSEKDQIFDPCIRLPCFGFDAAKIRHLTNCLTKSYLSK